MTFEKIRDYNILENNFFFITHIVLVKQYLLQVQLSFSKSLREEQD